MKKIVLSVLLMIFFTCSCLSQKIEMTASQITVNSKALTKDSKLQDILGVFGKAEKTKPNGYIKTFLVYGTKGITVSYYNDSKKINGIILNFSAPKNEKVFKGTLNIEGTPITRDFILADIKQIPGIKIVQEYPGIGIDMELGNYHLSFLYDDDPEIIKAAQIWFTWDED